MSVEKKNVFNKIKLSLYRINKLRKMTKEQMMEQLTETVSHPQFDALVHEIDDQPSENRLNYAKQNATISEMQSRGIPIPEGFRICVRMFEDNNESSVNFDKIDISAVKPPEDEAKWTICASLGFYFCVSVGRTNEVATAA